jgi:hypothetical protein
MLESLDSMLDNAGYVNSAEFNAVSLGLRRWAVSLALPPSPGDTAGDVEALDAIGLAYEHGNRPSDAIHDDRAVARSLSRCVWWGSS